MIELFDWQKPIAGRVREVLAGDIAVNAMPTGSGKTFLAVNTAKAMNLPFLVISPKATLINWERVAAQFDAGHLLRGVVNPERISLGRCPWYDGTNWNLSGVGLVIWDEFHKGASGFDAKATLAAARLKRQPCKKLIMSATVADSPLKMRALGYLLGLHDFSRAGFHNWASKHGCFWNRYLPRPVFQFTKAKAAAAKHMSEIHASISDRMIYMKIADIPGFPTTLIESKLYELDKVDAAAVGDAYDSMDLRMKDNGTSLLTELLHARERSEFCKAWLLADLVEDILEEGRSAVVFLNFRSSLKRLAEKLTEKGLGGTTSFIHGDQNAVERQSEIDRFQDNKATIMLAMIQAGGVGISLHDVKKERPRASLLTPGFNASETVQALGRIWRAGGTPTTQQFILASGTIEERVHERVSAKLSCIERLNDGDLT